jgi:hypothetical protein
MSETESEDRERDEMIRDATEELYAKFLQHTDDYPISVRLMALALTWMTVYRTALAGTGKLPPLPFRKIDRLLFETYGHALPPFVADIDKLKTAWDKFQTDHEVKPNE